MQPNFSVVVFKYGADRTEKATLKDVTDRVRPRLVELRTIDHAGYTSDWFEIEVDDAGAVLELKDLGENFEVAIGYGDDLLWVGDYQYDEAELAGPPNTMRIVASAIDFLAPLKARRTVSWDDVTLGGVIETLAARYDYVPAVHADFQGVAIEHIDQANQSDLELLTELGKRYGFAFKALKGYFIVTPAGAGVTAGGSPIPPFVVRPQDVSRWKVTHRARNRYGAVTAKWYDYDAARVRSVTVGQESPDNPTKEMRDIFKDEDEARAAAAAELKRRQAAAITASITMPGPSGENAKNLLAEGVLKMEGFRPGADAEYHITSVERTLNARGYQVRIEAEIMPQESGQ